MFRWFPLTLETPGAELGWGTTAILLIVTGAWMTGALEEQAVQAERESAAEVLEATWRQAPWSRLPAELLADLSVDGRVRYRDAHALLSQAPTQSAAAKVVAQLDGTGPRIRDRRRRRFDSGLQQRLQSEISQERQALLRIFAAADDASRREGQRRVDAAVQTLRGADSARGESRRSMASILLLLTTVTLLALLLPYLEGRSRGLVVVTFLLGTLVGAAAIRWRYGVLLPSRATLAGLCAVLVLNASVNWRARVTCYARTMSSGVRRDLHFQLPVGGLTLFTLAWIGLGHGRVADRHSGSRLLALGVGVTLGLIATALARHINGLLAAAPVSSGGGSVYARDRE